MFGVREGFAVVALLIAGCTHVPAPRADCGATISMPREILETRVLLLGEIHGTAEAPRFTGDLVCQLASAGKYVVLGVEHQSDLQSTYDRVMSGEADAIADLSRQMSWSGKITDGRFTRAMADMLVRVRDMRAMGLKVHLRAIDASPVEIAAAIREGRLRTARDERMAANVDEIARSLPAGAIVVVLAGNIHTMRIKEPLGAAAKVAPPMGYLLQSRGVRSLELAHRGGTASIHGAPAKGKTFGPQGIDGPVWSIELYSAPTKSGVDGVYRVGPISASPHHAN